ncbi:MAG: hypothetical protein AB7F75_00210 [Planctomycetota bacterium]
MSSITDIGSLNTQQFSRISSQMAQGPKVLSEVASDVGRVGGAATANKAPGYNPQGIGLQLDLLV